MDARSPEPIHVLVADDEAPARQRLIDLLAKDAQIASVKQRLHLTPDQERMWPAVEVALRNIGSARVRDARQRGARPGATACGVRSAPATERVAEAPKSAFRPATQLSRVWTSLLAWIPSTMGGWRVIILGLKY